MKKIATAFFALLPGKLAHFFLKIIGHKVSWRTKIGFSFIYIDNLELHENSKIGHFNFIKINNLYLSNKAVIKNLNFFKGPFHVKLNENAIIGKQNRFQRAKHPISFRISFLELGNGTNITSGNYLDLTKSIVFGEHCQVAGIGTQFWTHGYIHANQGIDRIRIDGNIKIGNNVYIGTRCVFNPGVTVANAINIGGNSVISKDLLESGMYVSQPLRHLNIDINKAKEKFIKIEDKSLIEEVYIKRNEI